MTEHIKKEIGLVAVVQIMFCDRNDWSNHAKNECLWPREKIRMTFVTTDTMDYASCDHLLYAHALACH